MKRFHVHAHVDDLKAADMTLLDEGETTCCYARSEKHWVTDPQGIAWEHFRTLANMPVFSGNLR
jgi:lactoylglutathione lyase